MENNNLDNNINTQAEPISMPKESMDPTPVSKSSSKQIVATIIVVGVFIVGAILLRGSKPPAPLDTTADTQKSGLVEGNILGYNSLGNPDSQVILVEYADFQCPFCGKFYKENELSMRNDYINTGKVAFVYKDFPFLGLESVKSAEAARCAEDQGKFWEYHDYLFTHQAGENQGAFSDDHLKSFAKQLGLEETSFDTCLDQEKYLQAIKDSKSEGDTDGVQGTPKILIMKNGKVIDTVEGAETYDVVKGKIEKALLQ